ncbi:MAG: type II toxin-antitoxin system VapC family toxin [Methanoculleaceae archaeon]
MCRDRVANSNQQAGGRTLAADRDGHSQGLRVLLDANALMIPAQFGVDIFTEMEGLLGRCRPFTLGGVVEEIRRLSRGRGRDAAAARTALRLADRIQVVGGCGGRGPVDDQIIEYAVRTGCLVMTNDRDLRDALLSRGIGVIALRKQRRLELIRR